MPIFKRSKKGGDAPIPVSPGGGSAHRKSVAGTVSPAQQLVGPWHTSAPEGVTPTSPGAPKKEDDDADPDGHPCMALEPYARDNYHTTSRGFLGKKTMPMETLLSWKGKQIEAPLTGVCRDSNLLLNECVTAFGMIMSYMGDKKSKSPRLVLLKSLQMKLLEGNQDFRDEIFCQVCKQTTSNPDVNSDLRGWQLLLSVLAVATPGEQLAPCFKKHCELGPVGSIPQTYAQYALSVLLKEPKLKPRTAAPGDVEIMALVQLSAVPVLVSLQDGNTVEVMADSWTSVSDLEKQIGQKLNLQVLAAFCVYEVSNTDGERPLGAKERILDTVAQWRTQALATSGVKKFLLVYKLRLHIRPNENDATAVKLNYLQAIEDMRQGTYMVSTEDCVQLAAFQLQASNGDYDKKKNTVAAIEKELTMIVPPQILDQEKSDEFHGTKDMAKKIMTYYMMSLKGVSKKDARALFMGLMYEIPSFGRHYFVATAMDTTVAVGIGADGVQFLDATDPDRNLLGQYPFSDIDSFTIVREDFAIMALVSKGGAKDLIKTKIQIESEEAAAMKSLVHAYFLRHVLPAKEKESMEKTAPVKPYKAR